EFAIGYKDAPESQAITIVSNRFDQNVILVKDAINEKAIQDDSQFVLRQPLTAKVDKSSKYQLVLSLQDIFVHGNTLYFRIQICNNSSIDFDIKSMKLLIRDKKKVKRTSSQESEIAPLFVGNKTEIIKGYTSKTMIYAVRKFTIPDGKALHINLFEDYGGRNLSLKVNNR